MHGLFSGRRFYGAMRSLDQSSWADVLEGKEVKKLELTMNHQTTLSLADGFRDRGNKVSPECSLPTAKAFVS